MIYSKHDSIKKPNEYHKETIKQKGIILGYSMDTRF